MNTTLYIWAGWLVDGTGGPARRDVLIHVEGGKIVSLRRMRLEDKLALENRLMDFSECTVLPGLIDSHVHLTLSGTADAAVRQKQLGRTRDEAMPVIHAHLAQSLCCGVTAVRDGGDAASHTLDYVVDPSRHILPVRVRASGRAWRARGRYGRIIGRPPLEGLSLAQSIASDPSPQHHVKIVNSGVNSLKEFGKETRPQFSSSELDAAVQAARRKGLKTMVHANGTEPVRGAVDAGATSIEHGFFMGKENLERMAELQVFWVPTAVTMKAYARELSQEGDAGAEIARRILEHQMEQMAYARRLGVPVAVGTDSGSLGVHHGQAVAEEMAILVDAGYTMEEAVCCATADASRLLGLRGETGQIKKGMEGTFVVVAGPPETLLRRMSRPEKVFVQGRLAASEGRVNPEV